MANIVMWLYIVLYWPYNGDVFGTGYTRNNRSDIVIRDDDGTRDNVFFYFY